MVNVSLGEVLVRYDPKRTSPDALAEALVSSGWPVLSVTPSTHP